MRLRSAFKALRITDSLSAGSATTMEPKESSPNATRVLIPATRASLKYSSPAIRSPCETTQTQGRHFRFEIEARKKRGLSIAGSSTRLPTSGASLAISCREETMVALRGCEQKDSADSSIRCRSEYLRGRVPKLREGFAISSGNFLGSERSARQRRNGNWARPLCLLLST